MTPVNRTTTLLLFLFLSSLSSTSYSLPLPSISFTFPSDSLSPSSSFPLLSIQNHRLTKRQDPAVSNDAGSTGTEPQPRSQGGAVSRLGVIEFGAFNNGHHPVKSGEKNGGTNEGSKDQGTPESQGKSEPINADASAKGETEKKEVERKEVQDQDKVVERREKGPVQETTRDDRRSVVKGDAKDQVKVVRKARVVTGQPPKSRGSDQVRSSWNPRLRIVQPDVAREEFENDQSRDRQFQERRARKVVVTRPRINNDVEFMGKIDQEPKRTIGRKFADSHHDIAIDGPMEHHAVGRKSAQHKRGRKCRRVSYG
ncbi:hypothetical protein BKA69DRAFT_1128258 [Paraphysoderma sedebokerense]|nr:hypothetical protein BKA69DRAFT_922345 [Paraphysoderma sedebokerense]KAI9137393.1 hypothetical protein BKA69DRAFT_1128258 [Paraphysoderma sedebokerense]